jgi:fermentation-respiration switch protein FrsA (DUF1100 family)
VASRGRRGLLFSLGVAAASLYLVAALTLYAIQRRLIYPGQSIKTREQPLPVVAGLEVFRVATPTGQAEAWYLPPLGSAVPFPALIFAHGNGEVIDLWATALDEFRRWGLAVMLVEYPGYGRSDGSPSEAGIGAAMSGAYDILVARPGVDRGRIVGYGQSLGGGAIAALSERRSLRAMILPSTVTSLRAFASRYWMPAFLLRDRFDNVSAVRKFSGRILVLHGVRDELIPYQQGVTLANANARAELRLYECDHGCWLPDGLPILRDIRSFLQTSGVLRAQEE